MMMLKQVALLALVGTTFAAPLVERDWQGGYGHWPSGGWHWPGYQPESTPTTTNSPPANSAPAESPAPAAPAPAPSSSASPPSTGSSGGSDYMSIVNKWRAAGGLSDLTEDSTLQGNALKTATDGHGQMKHELNPGSMAQVLAPGSMSNFESIYVGGWLCEIPSLPGLDGICSSMDKGWDHSNGETGHADILTSKSYSKIGCSVSDGIVACDLA